MVSKNGFVISQLNNTQKLLGNSAYFAGLGESSFKKLCELTTKVDYAAGEPIVKQGERGDDVYLIISGEASVTCTRDNNETEFLAMLYPGDWIGTGLDDLLPDTWERTATVRTNSPVCALRICARDYNQLGEDYPDVQRQLHDNHEKILFYHFIKGVNLFNDFSHNKMEELYERIETTTVDVNTEIIAEGKRNDQCYFIYAGSVEVRSQASDKVLANLHTGHLFGEMSLLSDEPCNATVKSMTPCVLLALKKEDLHDFLLESADFSTSMSSFLLHRSRPVAASNVEVMMRHSSDDQPIYILKNKGSLQFFQLSPEGYFLWNLLDGHLTMRELIEAYMIEFKSFDLSRVSAIIMRLSLAGFVHIPKMAAPFATKKQPFLKRLATRIGQVAEWNIVLEKMSPLITKLYDNKIIQALYSRTHLTLMSVLALLGIITYTELLPSSLTYLSTTPNLWLFFVLIFPLRFISIILHELGHAFMTLSYQQPLKACGVGWYWFAPIAYIDTSSMWSLSKKPRMLVDIAGILSDGVFASLMLIAAYFIGSAAVTAAAWLFATLAYINVIINLNPFIKLDGYYLLMDALDEPNLRSRTFRAVLGLFKNSHSELKKSKAITYLLSCAAYIALIGIILYTVPNIITLAYPSLGTL